MLAPLLGGRLGLTHRASTLTLAGTPLGDPIEVGALGSAVAAPGASRVVALGSSKSCYGHTEGTAGLTGTLLAAAGMQHQLLPPIVNLRELNPYVSAALADWRSRHGLAAAPSRQLAPCAHLAGAGGEPLAGTSSFGMSGVNAHALLSAAPAASLAAGADAATASSAAITWQRTQFWPSPLPHPVLLAATARLAGSAARLVECVADLAAPGLAWMQDHAVQGRALLPGAAMFEMAAAAATACLPLEGGAGAGTLPALSGLSIMVPCVLPAPSSPSLLLRCSFNARSGALEIGSGAGARHLQGAAAAVRPLPGAAQQPAPGRRVLAALIARPPSAGRGHNLARAEAPRQDTSG